MYGNQIVLRGVKQNNLKNIDITFPLGKLTVVTGLSGSGKSSLVFETLHAEGQRRYVETFSAYSRQFMDLLQPPDLESAENIRPSIAIQQKNTVKTSRSTVGTMTELTDYFKAWFSANAELIDPQSGDPIKAWNSQKIWDWLIETHPQKIILFGFPLRKPENFTWKEILESVKKQGYSRVCTDQGIKKRQDLSEQDLSTDSFLAVVQDRVKVQSRNRNRFIESAEGAWRMGEGALIIFDEAGEKIKTFYQKRVSPLSGKEFRDASPSLFSFNSSLGACPTCRGFGRVIEISPELVIPDPTLSIKEGAIRAFQGGVYGESLQDLLRAAKKAGVRVSVPWQDLSPQEMEWVWKGDPNYQQNAGWQSGWYGVQRFFSWLESQRYKMHVRVMLAKFRSYQLCPTCQGKRLQPESMNWFWSGYTLPDLYQMRVSELYKILHDTWEKDSEDLLLDGILQRLEFLIEVGLGYLTLDRSSRTLSGGETQRVNLTSCLGNGLVDTLFVLDEPSVGLHACDMDRLIGILRRLTDAGNTVVVVEHDEAIMRAADHLIEIGPQPGIHGGKKVFSGSVSKILRSTKSTTGAFLSGLRTVKTPKRKKLPSHKESKFLTIKNGHCHNITDLNISIPLQNLIGITGLSGSGKSSLLHGIIYEGLTKRYRTDSGSLNKEPQINSQLPFDEIVRVDQSPLSRTPRSNPATYIGVWDQIRKLLAETETAQQAGFTTSSFSFNAGDGRCTTCGGLGYEQVEMQFLADVYTPCSACEGKRFKEATLKVLYSGLSADQILDLSIIEALKIFERNQKIVNGLQSLEIVGLGYLKLGQPLNTLSGGESQRLKLVKYLSSVGIKAKPSLILLDEPTTGLHRADVECLLKVLYQLVNAGHSVMVVEHQWDILRACDYLIEMGPGAGKEGGKVLNMDTPKKFKNIRNSMAAKRLYPTEESYNHGIKKPDSVRKEKVISIVGARENNLKNISLKIPHGKVSVLTGVSGSGKSSLAFDIIFAEGQRRFMESMSAYTRQFVEPLSKPELDHLSGIPPSVAIEQRVNHGTRKSTVATITEVAQYLRLLYARVGVLYNPKTGNRVVPQSGKQLEKVFTAAYKKLSNPQDWDLCVRMARGRKGHFEPLANWAKAQGYPGLICDGTFQSLDPFEKLSRYQEHDVDLVYAKLGHSSDEGQKFAHKIAQITGLGTGDFYLRNRKGLRPIWFSQDLIDPETGEAFQQFDPKDFSWNAPRGWCSHCQGYGKIYPWMAKDPSYPHINGRQISECTCPACNGERLKLLSRSVFLETQSEEKISLPQLLSKTPSALMECLRNLKGNPRDHLIIKELVPQIAERISFMKAVGLDYLSMDRSTETLSGGEAQRIRLASQLGSVLSGVLYVLDEPSIGLHARDSNRLWESIQKLKDRGNTILMVEHDPDLMKKADTLIDIGPGAGKSGGEIQFCGSWKSLTKYSHSETGKSLKLGIPHPLQKEYRNLPKRWKSYRKGMPSEWMKLTRANLRNLRGDDLWIPLGRMMVLCGVSGAGKSTLIRDLLAPLVRQAVLKKAERIDKKTVKSLFSQYKESVANGLYFGNQIRKVIEVDQAPIGKTLRSCPATYIGAYEWIRQQFASLPEARMRGWTTGTFSFNTAGGRCETCKGNGQVRVEMNFLPDTFSKCEDCGVSRFAKELSNIRWKGKNIGEVLQMTFEEAVPFFAAHQKLHAMMSLMVDAGLGYLNLGQYSPTLSGGEAQRLKLVAELIQGMPSIGEIRRATNKAKNLYILEEPSIGLHLSDIIKLIKMIHKLVDQGHTVIVIEHHLDIIKEADYLVEIGPEAGNAGGQILFQGTLMELKCAETPTSRFL